MELLGEASVVEGCQVEQVFAKDRELKFKRPPDVVSKANLFSSERKKLRHGRQEFLPFSSSLSLHFSQKRFRVWSVASCTEKV
jgi:hypothetical protein